MGSCASLPMTSSTHTLTYQDFQPTNGCIVLLEVSSRPNPCLDNILYMVRAQDSWHSANACGYLTEAPQGGWNVVLAGTLPVALEPEVYADGRAVQIPLPALLAGGGIKSMWVAPIPAFSPAELKQVQAFTSEALNTPKCCSRVHLVAQRGRKVLLARLVGDMLVAAGRMKQNPSSVAEYRGAVKPWRMPDLITLEQLPTPPSNKTRAQSSPGLGSTRTSLTMQQDKFEQQGQPTAESRTSRPDSAFKQRPARQVTAPLTPSGPPSLTSTSRISPIPSQQPAVHPAASQTARNTSGSVTAAGTSTSLLGAATSSTLSLNTPFATSQVQDSARAMHGRALSTTTVDVTVVTGTNSSAPLSTIKGKAPEPGCVIAAEECQASPAMVSAPMPSALLIPACSNKTQQQQQRRLSSGGCSPRDLMQEAHSAEVHVESSQVHTNILYDDGSAVTQAKPTSRGCNELLGVSGFSVPFMRPFWTSKA